MGTNFYACPQNGLFPETEKFELSVIKGKAGIHIAKRSCGYKPLFHAYDFINSTKELEKFVSTYDALIVDEYGEEYSFERFCQEVIEWGKGKKLFSHSENMGEDCFKDEDGNEFLKRGFT